MTPLFYYQEISFFDIWSTLTGDFGTYLQFPFATTPTPAEITRTYATSPQSWHSTRGNIAVSIMLVGEQPRILSMITLFHQVAHSILLSTSSSHHHHHIITSTIATAIWFYSVHLMTGSSCSSTRCNTRELPTISQPKYF